MIHIRISMKDQMIKELEISGHAGYREHGEDLVCAAVSGIAFGLCNAADILLKGDPQVKDNLIRIRIDDPDERSEMVMRTGMIQLQTIAESCQNYVKIEITEVSI